LFPSSRWGCRFVVDNQSADHTVVGPAGVERTVEEPPKWWESTKNYFGRGRTFGHSLLAVGRPAGVEKNYFDRPGRGYSFGRSLPAVGRPVGFEKNCFGHPGTEKAHSAGIVGERKSAGQVVDSPVAEMQVEPLFGCRRFVGPVAECPVVAGKSTVAVQQKVAEGPQKEQIG